MVAPASARQARVFAGRERCAAGAEPGPRQPGCDLSLFAWRYANKHGIEVLLLGQQFGIADCGLQMRFKKIVRHGAIDCQDEILAVTRQFVLVA
jgi:hypothetical protein